jgi:hypothetical protein
VDGRGGGKEGQVEVLGRSGLVAPFQEVAWEGRGEGGAGGGGANWRKERKLRVEVEGEGLRTPHTTAVARVFCFS